MYHQPQNKCLNIVIVDANEKQATNYKSIDSSMKSKRVMRSYDQSDSPFKSVLVDLMAIQ